MGMSGDVKRDVFGYSGDFRPMLQRIVHRPLVRQRKDKIAIACFAALRQPLQRLVRNRQVKRFFGLLHRDFDANTPSAPLQVTPLQLANIADAQATQAAEKKSPLDDFVPTLGIYQRLQLVDRQILAAARLLPHLACEIELFGRIDGDNPLLVSAIDSRSERSVVGDDRIIAQ